MLDPFFRAHLQKFPDPKVSVPLGPLLGDKNFDLQLPPISYMKGVMLNFDPCSKNWGPEFPKNLPLSSTRCPLEMVKISGKSIRRKFVVFAIEFWPCHSNRLRQNLEQRSCYAVLWILLHNLAFHHYLVIVYLP